MKWLTNSLVRSLPVPLIHRLLNKRTAKYEHVKKAFLRMNPALIELLQEKYLLYSFHLNAQRIPHYRKFLRRSRINPAQIRTVHDFLQKIPETNKENYIYKTKDICQMCINGDYHNVNLFVKSSGHSGRQCYWAKSHKQDLYGRTALSIGLDENFDANRRKTLIINGFLLGSWVTGINFNELASWHCPIINVGPDKEEIFQTIEELGPSFEQIIITGYPPFIKELVEYGNSRHFPWKKQLIHFIAGGEDFPESWRRYVEGIIKRGKVRSGFGASDIGILGGMENDATVRIRQLADRNEEFRKALFGEVDETPMLFQYAYNLYINTNSNHDLIFTSLLPEEAQPLIKYNLQDTGGTISYAQMEKLLREHNIRCDVRLPLPFLYVIGRKSGSVNFNAFLIYPENVEECVYRNPQMARTSTGKFHFGAKYDQHLDRHLHIDMQLKPGIKPTKTLQDQYTSLMVKTLQEVNGGFRITYQRLRERAHPHINLYAYDKYPQQNKIKNVYTMTKRTR